MEKELYALVQRCVAEGLKCIKLLKEKGDNTYIHRYFDWVNLSYKQNGMPDFSKSFEGPEDYSQYFNKKEDISQKFFILLNEFKDYIIVKNLKNTVFSDIPDGEFLNIYIQIEVSNLVQRYIHIHSIFDFDDKKFDMIYKPWSNSIFNDKLAFDIFIPILFINFNFDKLVISETLEIVKMDEKFQQARYPVKAYGPGVHQQVLLSATHSLVLKGWEVKNNDRTILSRLFSNTEVYPLNIIDKFYAALRIYTEYYTGYAQIIVKPKDWVHYYKADLPDLNGTSIRAYPYWFENFYWNSETLPVITKEQSIVIGELFLKLIDIKEKNIEIAIKRLNQCSLREYDEDIILDATIALEALLNDDEKQEMTHKLALRVAALSNFFKSLDKSPIEVFNDIKKIYSYRSAVVHGSQKTDKNKEIKVKDNIKVKTTSLAIDYLKKVLETLINYPEYRDVKKIDEKLLLGSVVTEEKDMFAPK